MTNAIMPAAIVPSAALTDAAAPRRPAASVRQSFGRDNLEARYSFNEELAQIIVTLRNVDTGEVVRQIPPEKILQFAEFLLRRTGRILDARA